MNFVEETDTSWGGKKFMFASKESRQVVSDGQHRLEPREKLEKFCPTSDLRHPE